MTIESLRLQLDALDRAELYEPTHFQGRAVASDAVASEIIDRIDELLGAATPPRHLRALREAAERFQQRLHAADEEVFRDLRAHIRDGLRGEPLWRRIEYLVGAPITDNQQRAVVGYDHLDRLVTGLLDGDEFPEPERELEPEMVLYQRTPARIVFALVRRASLGTNDCFYDLGSGLGHVTTLVHLLSGVPARGVEFEPAFCAYAQARAAALKLEQVAFVNADARQADYADGTLFFMYTPFEGTMMLEMLARLRERAQHGPIRLATYGACTAVVAQQNWLSAPTPAEPGNHRLAIFSSRNH